MMELDTVICGDCLDILPTIPDASVDAVVTDPPYPHIKRDYGYWTTEQWWALMVDGVIPQVRRILKPSGSAVFILQPNSEKVGKMRGWLWEFMAWVCREWNMVQDAYWWNYTAPPVGEGIHRDRGLMKPSIRLCVWCGTPDGYRNQNAVLWKPSRHSKIEEKAKRIDNDLEYYPSNFQRRQKRISQTVLERNGTVPYNLIPFANANSVNSAGANGHGAGTPLELADWWLRYIVPPGGLVVDPFIGSGTTALAAIKQRKHFFGCDKVPGYVEIANRRIEEARAEMAQLELAL